MAARMPEKYRSVRYAHYATNSPLKPSKDDIFRAAMQAKRQPPKRDTFILDGVREQIMHSSVIPSYNAYNDRHSQVYFRSPRVQAMLRRAEALGKGEISTGIADFKLSTRQRIPGTPVKDEMSHKETRFIIDCVRTDTLKSKRNPVIPSYDALHDEHSRGYFRRRSVKELVKRTLNSTI